MAILIVKGFGLALLFTAVFFVTCLQLPKQVRVFSPKVSVRRLAFYSTLPLPVFSVSMAVIPWIPSLIGTHRGAEVVLIYITLFALPFVFLLGWPICYFFLHRRILRTERAGNEF